MTIEFLTHNAPVDAAAAVADYTNGRRDRKIKVERDLECIRFGKIVHIKGVRRLPIIKDGKVYVRELGKLEEVKATVTTFRNTLSGRTYNVYTWSFVYA